MLETIANCELRGSATSRDSNWQVNFSFASAGHSRRSRCDGASTRRQAAPLHGVALPIGSYWVCGGRHVATVNGKTVIEAALIVVAVCLPMLAAYTHWVGPRRAGW